MHAYITLLLLHLDPVQRASLDVLVSDYMDKTRGQKSPDAGPCDGEQSDGAGAAAL